MPSFVLTGFIPSFSNQASDVLLMTGATDNHALGSFNCMYSMILANPYASIVYINYGLEEKHLQLLKSHFISIHQIHSKLRSDAILGYREFNWDNFPSWIRLIGNQEQRGGYAWKMVAYSDVVFEWRGVVGWLDGGSIIIDSLNREMTAVRQFGVFSPSSAGRIETWVHNDTLDYMKEHHYIGNVDMKRVMSCGGHLFTYWNNETVMNRFMYPYRECAFTQKCVTPKRANMRNHRQDQAVVSVLLAELNVPRSSDGKYHWIPALRQERGNNERATRTVLFNLFLNIQNTYGIRFNNTFYPTRNISYSHQQYKFASRKMDSEWP